jgi:predicted Fe-Mo cluster-binding NifX family protein
MKIIITTQNPNIDALMDARFGRASYFMEMDDETLAWEAHDNPAVVASGGAGSQAAQFVSGLGAKAVISGAFGPNAFRALDAAGIKMYLCHSAYTARQALDEYRAGRLEPAAPMPGHGRHG